MSNSPNSLSTAVRFHQSGRLDEAAQIYRQILDAEPDHADALHLLGLVELAQGHAAQALEHLARAVKINPNQPQFHARLGLAYHAAGQHSLAIASFREALRLDPAAATSHYELGNVLRDTGQLADAEACYRQAVKLDFLLAEAHNNLGNVLAAQKRTEEALESFREALRRRPGVCEVQFNLGNCLAALARFDEAADAYRAALATKPDFALAHQQLGWALYNADKFPESETSYREALRLQPDAVEAIHGLALALQNQHRFTEAEANYRRELELNPTDVNAQFCLGTAVHLQRRLAEAQSIYEQCAPRMGDSPKLFVYWGECLQQQGQNDAAEDLFRRAIALDPEFDEAHFFLGTLLLSRGQLAEGWPEYEHRLNTRGAWYAEEQKLWSGEPLDGQQILVYAEMGLGDTLQFIRYLPLVRERGGEPIVAVPKSLVPLLSESGFQGLVAIGSDVRLSCRWRAAMVSLPRVFETTLETIPAQVPYLHANPVLVAQWRERLAALPGFKIGLQWAGSKLAAASGRNIPLELFEPLARIPGVTLISLQKNAGSEEIAALKGRMDVFDFGPELDEAHGAFMDTAALVKSLDLVISVDTATAHLAGALGAPVWVAIMQVAEWRWLENRDDSPWYPTMKLFRQRRLDDWGDVIQRMAAELKQLLAARGSA